MEIDAECYSECSLTFLQLFPRCKRFKDNDFKGLKNTIFLIAEIDTECNETSSYTLNQDFLCRKRVKITPRFKKVANTVILL